MAADTDRAVLDEAWGHISQTRDTTVGLGSFTRQRIERIIGYAAALGSTILGGQAVAGVFSSAEEQPEWKLPLLLLTFLPLAAMIAACLFGRFVRTAAGVFAVAYVIALVLWPLAAAGSMPTPGTVPWIYLFVNISTLAAVLAFPLALQLAWTIAIPLLWGLVRLIQVDFDSAFTVDLALDVSFTLMLGGVLMALGWVFRSLASNVDGTRARAVDAYADAAASAASEQERFAVAALMHDSVLAALIAVERATTPRERTLAAAMSREALTRLANAEQDSGEGSDAPRPIDSVADDIEREASELGVRLAVARSIAPAAPPIPGRVARALALAATQGVANAVQHAGGRGLSVSVSATDTPAVVRIAVRDTGAGFDFAKVPDDRLGIRASIIARVAAIGGSTDIVSDASGTTITLEWGHPEQ
ncbi:ATP-binding protein [Microbacterium sp. 1P10UB]|uniref:sensor histidine kinase n=1 Tax=unclassified Microbacterium TaxID=2609290 RepID=UPI0039A043DB